MYSPPFMNELLSEKKTFNEMSGNIPGGNFPEENFPGESLMGLNFPSENFLRILIFFNIEFSQGVYICFNILLTYLEKGSIVSDLLISSFKIEGLFSYVFALNIAFN